MADEQKLTMNQVQDLREKANRMPARDAQAARDELSRAVKVGEEAFSSRAAFIYAQFLVDNFIGPP